MIRGASKFALTAVGAAILITGLALPLWGQRGGGSNLYQPQLASITCPGSVRGGHTFNCTVVVQNAPSSGATVQLLANQSIVSIPANVKVSQSGHASFSGTAMPMPDNTPATISASYLGTVKQAKLTVLPVWISSFSVSPQTVYGFNIYVSLRLTAPAPSGGLKIPLQVPSEIANPKSFILVPEKQTNAYLEFNRKGVTKRTTVHFAAIDPSDHEGHKQAVDLLPPEVIKVIVPATLQVPITGAQITVRFDLTNSSPFPNGGMPYKITYAVQGNYAASDVQGPSSVLAHGIADNYFQITVRPCGAPPCSVTVTVGNKASAPMQVNN